MTYPLHPHTLSVAVADDHPMIRLAIKDILGTIGFQVVALCQSGKALFETLDQQRFDLIVTDFSMERAHGNEDGLRLIQRVRSRHPDTPVVVFTMLTNSGLLACIRAEGVAGIVGKSEDPEILKRICLNVATGSAGPHLSPAIADRIASAGGRASANACPLSPKEIEVVRMFANGDSLTSIATSFHRSLATIAAQKRSAMQKLNIANNADLITYARDHGLV
ncbi:MAG TPA: response regulator transcription factor [Paraburkholderia sp.]|uniref:response regulator transcription factor n=1 Tax=Paraburkholderia sp. TaxID=1926495 RepID=UPI002B49FD02|nr:response regulator transcription factor [Paraburkholderia sp.]HKR45612.1 response regulator transcription factor [Paraburkholderia sp.]